MLILGTLMNRIGALGAVISIVATSFTRITEASDTRITEAGDTRITEGT